MTIAGMGNGGSGAGYTAIFDPGVIRVLRTDSHETVSTFVIGNGPTHFTISDAGIVEFHRSDGAVILSIVGAPDGGPFPPAMFKKAFSELAATVKKGAIVVSLTGFVVQTQ